MDRNRVREDGGATVERSETGKTMLLWAVGPLLVIAVIVAFVFLFLRTDAEASSYVGIGSALAVHGTPIVAVAPSPAADGWVAPSDLITPAS
jgi:hypothetical protein